MLVRMDVHVDFARRHVEEDDGDGEASLHQQSAVGVLDRDGDGAMLHGAPVDEEGYAGTGGAAALRRGGEPPNGVGSRPGRDVQHRGGEFGAERGGRGVAQIPVARRRQLRLAVRLERHSDVGACEREALHRLAYAGGFGGGGADELQAGGNGGEERLDLDGRARGGAGFAPADDLAALQLDGDCGFRVRRSRRHADGRGGGDAGERLASKAERADPRKVVFRLEFAGRVTLKGEFDLLRGDSAAVVGHADGGEPAVPRLDGDGARARVERVLDEFLDDRGGALNHLAGGDAGGGRGGQRADGHRYRPPAPGAPKGLRSTALIALIRSSPTGKRSIIAERWAFALRGGGNCSPE